MLNVFIIRSAPRKYFLFTSFVQRKTPALNSEMSVVCRWIVNGSVHCIAFQKSHSWAQECRGGSKRVSVGVCSTFLSFFFYVYALRFVTLGFSLQSLPSCCRTWTAFSTAVTDGRRLTAGRLTWERWCPFVERLPVHCSSNERPPQPRHRGVPTGEISSGLQSCSGM